MGRAVFWKVEDGDRLESLESCFWRYRLPNYYNKVGGGTTLPPVFLNESGCDHSDFW